MFFSCFIYNFAHFSDLFCLFLIKLINIVRLSVFYAIVSLSFFSSCFDLNFCRISFFSYLILMILLCSSSCLILPSCLIISLFLFDYIIVNFLFCCFLAILEFFPSFPLMFSSFVLSTVILVVRHVSFVFRVMFCSCLHVLLRMFLCSIVVSSAMF